MLDPDFGALPPTQSVRQLIDEARHESDRLHHEYLGTEHLLLALTKDATDAALLPRLDVDTHLARQLLEEAVGYGSVTNAAGAELPFTTRTKKVFSLAAESAAASGQASWGAEHLVLGMLLEGRNIGAEVLRRCGLTTARAAAHAAETNSRDASG